MEQNNHQPEASCLRCYLLGVPRIEWGEQIITIPRRQARALLFYLATQAHPIHRGKLCFVFWPDIPENKARQNLSRLLNQLKNALGSDKLFVHSEDKIGMNPDLVWVDFIEFLLAIESKDYKSAITIYGGEFLEGFALPHNPEFEYWHNTEAQRAERAYLECLETALQALMEQIRYKEAIEIAHQYLKIDELAESIHRRLIEIYGAIGDRTAAIRQYKTCSAILERELGVDPLPETRVAYESALNESSVRITPQPIPARVSQAFATLPFVGREEPLRILNQTLERIAHSQGHIFLITGEAGIGKSRLLQTFLTRVQSKVVLLQARADPSMQNLPYALITQALRGKLGEGLIPSISQPDRISEAVRLLPELNTIYPDLPPLLPLDSDIAHIRLFDALCQITLSWSQESRPILLCLDDVQWADQTTLQWLLYFGSQIRDQAVLVIASRRPDEESSFDQFVFRSRQQGLLTEITLDGLKLPDVEKAFKEMALPKPIAPEFFDRVWRLSAGNPFFLSEIIHGLMEAGQELFALGDGDSLVLPETVLQAVEARLNKLSQVARQVLDAAAVIGNFLPFDLVRLTSGRTEEETGMALDELVCRNILVEEADLYHFQHEIIQMAVYRSLSRWRQRLLHRRAAQALQSLEPRNHSRLSWHFELAEHLDLAAQEAIQAGVAIKHLFAYHEALQYFNHALDLLEDDTPRLQDVEDWLTNWRLRLSALRERGWVYRLLGRMQAYEKDLQQETQLVEKLGDTAARVRLHFRRSALLRWFCRYDQALEVAQQGLQLNQEVGDRWLEVLGLREVGLAHREKGEYAAAQIALEKALAVIETLDDASMLIHVLGNLSSLFANLNEFERATEFAQRAMAICDQFDLRFECRLPLGDLGVAAAGKGEIVQARAWLHESLEIAHQIDDRTQEIFCLTHLGRVALQEKDAALALKNLSSALKLAEQVNSCGEQSLLHLHFAETYLLQGEYQKAREHAEIAFELAQNQNRKKESQISQKLLDKIRKLD